MFGDMAASAELIFGGLEDGFEHQTLPVERDGGRTGTRHGGGEGGEGAEDLCIDDAGVALTGDGVDAGEAEAFGDGEFELADFFVVAFEEFEEGGLGAGGALDAAEHEGLEAEFDFGEAEDEVVGPEDGAFADGGGLRGLDVGVGEAGEVLVLGGEGAEGV